MIASSTDSFNISAFTLPVAVENSENTIFFNKKNLIYAHNNLSFAKSSYGSYETPNQLMETLKKFGPLIAQGMVGPRAHHEPPYKLARKVDKFDIWGWESEAKLKEDTPRSNVMIIGVSLNSEKSADIYYVRAKDHYFLKEGKDIAPIDTLYTVHKESAPEDFCSKPRSFRAYSPSNSDNKVYTTTFTKFFNLCKAKIYPTCAYSDWLFSFPLPDESNLFKTINQIMDVARETIEYYQTWNIDEKNLDLPAAIQEQIFQAAFLIGKESLQFNLNPLHNPIIEAAQSLKLARENPLELKLEEVEFEQKDDVRMIGNVGDMVESFPDLIYRKALARHTLVKGAFNRFDNGLGPFPIDDF